jgi:hypothetical protein
MLVMFFISILILKYIYLKNVGKILNSSQFSDYTSISRNGGYLEQLRAEVFYNIILFIFSFFFMIYSTLNVLVIAKLVFQLQIPV